MPKAAGKVKPGKAFDFARAEIWFQGVRNRCVKCLGPLNVDEFVVNKDMAYCGDCAVLLHLGESKESRMFKDLRGIEGEPGREADLVSVAADVEAEDGNAESPDEAADA